MRPEQVLEEGKGAYFDTTAELLSAAAIAALTDTVATAKS
jgi:hypothetical protein